MSLFAFDKVFVREVPEGDEGYTCSEVIFLSQPDNALLMYSLGCFYLINKGSACNLSSFGELHFAAVGTPGQLFHI